MNEARDNFGMGFDIAGVYFAQLNDSATALPPGRSTCSDNLNLVANLPEAGTVHHRGSFNSDLAFKGNYAFAGNYDGFIVYDISKPGRPDVVAQVLCPGSQNDVSV